MPTAIDRNDGIQEQAGVGTPALRYRSCAHHEVRFCGCSCCSCSVCKHATCRCSFIPYVVLTACYLVRTGERADGGAPLPVRWIVRAGILFSSITMHTVVQSAARSIRPTARHCAKYRCSRPGKILLYVRLYEPHFTKNVLPSVLLHARLFKCHAGKRSRLFVGGGAV